MVGLNKFISIEEAAKLHDVSTSFIRKYILAGVVEVRKFKGKALRPYQIDCKALSDLFTVASLRSLKTEEIGKALGRKPSTKEELWP